MGKRMFSTSIIESDAFLDMPLTAQSLYMHLNMNADNDGFVNPKRVMRMIGAAADDLQILIAKRFLMAFDSGVVVIKHWWINNTKRADRYAPTSNQNELAELVIKKNNAYSKNIEQMALETEVGKNLATSRQESLPQYNTTQLNPTQLNPIAPGGAGFVKKKNINKKQYAKAVEADADLADRAKQNAGRKDNGYQKAIEIAKQIKEKKRVANMNGEEDLFYNTNAKLARELEYKLTEDEFYERFMPLMFRAGPEILDEAIAVVKNKLPELKGSTDTHRYLCGVIWNKIKNRNTGAYPA